MFEDILIVNLNAEEVFDLYKAVDVEINRVSSQMFESAINGEDTSALRANFRSLSDLSLKLLSILDELEEQGDILIGIAD